MCGILVTSGLHRPFSHMQLASLRARGPDAIGFWCDEHVNIAQTRLAIIGLDERGTEPLENASHVIAYNGEVYNFESIRRRVETEGVALAGANDAEVLLHAWSLWGTDILRDLTGFWAFVVYDKRRHRLTLVRDQLGIKPLYYSIRGEEVCVASMIRTIVEVGGRTRTLDYEALSEYAAYQFTFGDKTFFDDIKRVPPGHAIDIDLTNGDVSVACYEDIWSVGDEGLVPAATEEWVSDTRDLLAECVRESTVADVPFATFCSGGIDSSLLTRMTAPDLAYHGNYSDPECNETFFAKQVVEGTPTRLYVVNGNEAFDLVEKLGSIIGDFDDLTIGSVVLPLDDLLTQVARRHKVVLTGTGGDELFGGYVRYHLALGNCFQDSYKALFASMHDVRSVADRFELSHRKGNTGYFRFYDREVETTFRKSYEACREVDDAGAMLSFDRRYFLSGLLNIDDKMSARHSIESRPSFLHQRFARHVRQLAPSAIIGEGDLKAVLRRIAAPILPQSVLHRTDKMGFTTPIGIFVQRSSHLVREQLTTSRFRDLYDLGHINIAGQDKFSRQVFGLLMMDLWLNRYA